MRPLHVLLSIAIVGISSSAVRAQAPPPPPPIGPSVVVTDGHATVQRAPDRAFVTFGTETRGPKPDDVQKQNATAMAKVQEAITHAKIPSDAIRTLGLYLQEEFDWANGKRTSRGYTASNSVEVRVDDLAVLGAVIDAAVRAGATNVGAVRFDLKDRAGAEREALRLAVADARARADAAAAGASAQVLRVVRIEETGGPRQPVPMPAMRMAMAASAQAPETPVSPGQIEIEASVTLTATLEGR
jgi:uncharacterized protein YggE